MGVRMENHTIVSHDKWLEARKKLLVEEKNFSRLQDKLSELRRELPWEKVDKEYTFDSTEGNVTLSDLFDGRSQLIIYHFMFGKAWGAGCKSCSFLADHFNPAIVHLKQRDVSMLAVSRAPLEEILKFKDRMKWSFNWVSSENSNFNVDFHVSFSQDEIDKGDVYYNYKNQGFPSTEAPGASVFYKDEAGNIFHTYSTFARGLDRFITTYHYLDVVPKGRDEDNLPYTMDWIRLHDEY
jgi:predicted dithiol-disulfide oxidoreductase (DUF899 family)